MRKENKVDKIISIIESCKTVEQLEVAKNMLEFIDFYFPQECEKIKQVLINKQKILNQ